MGKNRDHSKFPNAITVLDNGNVGIGTNSPNIASFSGTCLTLEAGGSTSTKSSGIELAWAGATRSLWGGYSGGVYIGTWTNENFEIRTNAIERLRVTAAGKVGIANTNPNYNLTVDAVATDAISWRNRGTEVGRLGIEGDTSNGWLALFNSGVTRVQLTAGSGNSWVASNGGYFGIGTNSPQGKFHVDHEDAYHMGIQHNKTGTYVTETKFGRPSTTSSISIIYDIAGAEIAELRRNYSANTFRITNVSTTHLEINSSGVTTIPLQPSFSMYCSGNFTGPGVVPMGGTMYNDGGYYNTSTYRFTAPVAGRYLFSFYDNVMANNSNPSYFGFRVNGGIRGAYAYTSTKTVGNWYLLGFQQIIKLNASDYVDVYNFGADRTDYGSAEWGNFSGHLLG